MRRKNSSRAAGTAAESATVPGSSDQRSLYGIQPISLDRGCNVGESMNLSTGRPPGPTRHKSSVAHNWNRLCHERRPAIALCWGSD